MPAKMIRATPVRTRVAPATRVTLAIRVALATRALATKPNSTLDLTQGRRLARGGVLYFPGIALRPVADGRLDTCVPSAPRVERSPDCGDLCLDVDLGL